MPLDNFIKKIPEKKKKLFPDDPDAIQQALEEVMNAKNKTELCELADDYRVTGISTLKIDELRSKLYEVVRNGQSKLKKKWEAKCKCDTNQPFRKIVTKSEIPDPIQCEKCGDIIAFKRIKAK